MNDAERETLERRIDELCAEVEYNRQTSRSRLERIDQLKDENAKLCARIDELCAEVEKYRSARDASVDLATKTIDRIRELEAEVERLRNQLHDQQDTAGHNFVRNAREYKRVCDENAKLRELVSGLEYCAQGHVCDCCPLYDPSGTNRRRCESLERELGIEVGE